MTLTRPAQGTCPAPVPSGVHHGYTGMLSRDRHNRKIQFGSFAYSPDCVSESFDSAVSTAGQELKGAYKGSVHLTYPCDAGCSQPSCGLGEVDFL